MAFVESVGNYIEESESISEIQIKIAKLKNKYSNMAKLYEEQFIYRDNDVGIKHTEAKSHLKLYENGDIYLFTGNETGLIMNNEYGTFNVYGKAVNVNAPLIRLNTKPNGFMWNGHTLNYMLYRISDKKNPKFWNKNRTEPLPGKLYSDDLKLVANARYWCPGNPPICGNNEPHGGHWVRYTLSITPFYWARRDEEYREMLNKFNIPQMY